MKYVPSILLTVAAADSVSIWGLSVRLPGAWSLFLMATFHQICTNIYKPLNSQSKHKIGVGYHTQIVWQVVLINGLTLDNNINLESCVFRNAADLIILVKINLKHTEVKYVFNQDEVSNQKIADMFTCVICRHDVNLWEIACRLLWINIRSNPRHLYSTIVTNVRFSKYYTAREKNTIKLK